MDGRIFAEKTRIRLFEEKKDGRRLRSKDFLLESCIGTGASCVAYRAIGEDGIPVKLKQFCPDGMSRKDRLYQAAESRFVQAYQQQISMMMDEKTAAVTAGLYGLYRDEQGCLWTSVSAMVGRTLDTLLPENSLNKNLKILRSIAESIKAYHETGWLLLDMKPENILVIDSLGLHGINFFDFDSFIRIEELKRAADARETIMLSASEAYSAPELLEPVVDLKEIGITVDFYSIGAILFNAVFGKRPEIYDCLPGAEFRFTAIRESKREELSIEVQHALAAFFRRTLTMSPTDRYETDDELITAVNELLQLADVSKPRLSRGIPHASGSFVGRERERKNLAEAIRSSTAPLYVSGMGGIGKTQLLLKTAEDLREEFDFYFVSYKGSVKETVLSLPIENMVMERKDETGIITRIPNDERYRSILSCLRNNYRENSVLIIDNFDAPNDEDSPSLRYDKDFYDLETLPMRVIFTTRCRFENVRDVSVGTLDENAVVQMLSEAFPSDPEINLLEIANAVNLHTLTLSIIAGTAKESKGKLSAEKVLRELRSGVKDEGISSSIMENLRSIFKASEMSKTAQRLMACATLFPQGGISSDILVQLLSQEKWSAASQLERSGWLRFDRYSGVWMIHPLVRAVCIGEPETDPDRWKNVSDFVTVLRQLDKAGTFKTLDAEKTAQLNEVFSNIGRLSPPTQPDPPPDPPPPPLAHRRKIPWVVLLVIILLAGASVWFFRNANDVTPASPAPTPTQAPAPEKQASTIIPAVESVSVGDYVEFGAYEQDNNTSNGKEPVMWRVLDVQDGKALLLSKYVLDSEPYNSVQEYVTWENCSLRAWLNNEFISTAFSDAERTCILMTEISQDYGKKTTGIADLVFLLSSKEALGYLGNRKAVRATEYAIDRGVSKGANGCSVWWLRALANINHGIYIDTDGEIWSNGKQTDDVLNDRKKGVRPALWINVKSFLSLAEPKDITQSQSLSPESAVMEDSALVQKNKADTFVVGEIITIGSYEQDNNRSNGKEDIEWTVLATEGDSALVVSTYALDAQQYNSTKSSITWETCTLRSWLNETFLEEAFSTDEKERIILGNIKNYGNYHYNGADGADTSDKLFLLSLDEVERYFPSEKDRECVPTQYCRARGAAVISGNCEWWLRTKGGFSGGEAYVKNSGTIEYEGNYATHTDNAVRPAMWLSFANH